MDLSLTDKIVLIAGASRGIGLAIAGAFVREGATVVITGRNGGDLRLAVETIKREFPHCKILPVSADMTIPDEIDRALNTTLREYGKLDAAIANVGSGVSRSGWKLDPEDWNSALGKNLLGSVSFASAAIPYLIDQRGSFIFISSIAGWEAMNAPVAYSASKAALQSAMKNLSRLVGAQGVRINAVVPGNILFPGGTWEQKLQERKEFFEQYIRTEVSMQRFGKPEEIADAVVFLASERASFITGACLVVDGGQSRSL